MRKYFFLLLLFPLLCVYSQNVDIEILRDINLNRNKQLDGMFRGVTHSVGPVAVGIPIILYGVSVINCDSVSKQKAIFIGASVISATVLTTILKRTINRPRPFITYPDLEKVTSGGSASFPSGHTSDAFAFATSISMAYPKWYIIAPSYAWASAVGYSRLDLGVHYPSDVLFGAILGTGSAFLTYKVQQLLYKKKQSMKHKHLNVL